MRTFLCFFLLGAGWAHAQVRWEYATVEYCSISIIAGGMEGLCSVVYAAPEGVREEVVKVNEPVMQNRADQADRLALAAQQKTIARLGEQGWELVAVLGDPKLPLNRRIERQYFFKRKVEKK